ncbi:RNA polymerase factor sigma-54 [Shouchella lehensis]|uniref:RNA polymerase sigma-54 factor n=1 Tax=Shouchella lehensis G1 TaxID=1246626 RepID=A0A060LWC2_9BACI|nr:RNA polymerase factor sigma-54 [Shouchella lehensis]AIC95566.1 RNA polymerase sigma-54 factor [Shouchella lehensis G1]
MELGLFQKQTLNLVMTHELRQAIHLLQYSTLDVRSYLEELALENPLLELKNTYQKDNHPKLSSKTSDEKHQALENTPNANGTLKEYVNQQLVDLSLTPSQTKRLAFLIESLNEDGYLPESTVFYCNWLGCSEEELQEVVQILQSLEPAGVGAFSLAECLYLQVIRQHLDHPVTRAVILNDLEKVAERKWKQLAKTYGVTMLDIQEIYDVIRTLQPRPGASFYTNPTVYIEPDVHFTLFNGEILVSASSTIVPTVGINNEYKELLQLDQQTRRYCIEKEQQIEWLLTSLKQREKTILQVAEVISFIQAPYFLSKKGQLQPMTLQMIATELDIHESTVSRATANKYAQTPRGLLELKSLFTARASAVNDGISNASVKALLKQMIESENKEKPLSDQQIVELLKNNEGISLSRRVIAKYRDELGILSSVKRKRYDDHERIG